MTWLRSRSRVVNLSHNSRQITKCPTNLVHGIAGADNSASSRFKVKVPNPISDTPRILAEGHSLRASRSTLISSGWERPAALMMWMCRKSDTRLLRIARTVS